MIVVRIIGGLGNQMFQYAYAKSLQNKGYEVKIDISNFKFYKLHGGYQLDNFNIDIEVQPYLNTYLLKTLLNKTIREKTLLFDKNLLNPKKNTYLKGYFQNEKYFFQIRSILKKHFTLREKLSDSTFNFKKEIERYKNSCFIHVRRGDYIINKSGKTFSTCDISYYKKSIEFLKNNHKNIHFFVFSNDFNWCKKALKLDDTTFVEHKVTPHEDLYLMSLCKFSIIANSTFSWWGAWLSNHKEKIVIAPKKWLVKKENDIVCNNWIKI